MSPFYELYDDNTGYTWAVDVDLGDWQRSAAVASRWPATTRSCFYAEQGKPVALRKENGRYVVIGLSKTTSSWQHIMYVCFEDDVAEVIGDEMKGYKVRALTYGEAWRTGAQHRLWVFPLWPHGKIRL